MAFTYYRQLQFDKSKAGPSNLTNYPALVSISNVTFGSHVQSSSGYDIVFSTTLDGSAKVPWEVEYFDKSSGTLVAWVKISTLNGSAAGSNSSIYFCYGDASISSAQNTGAYAPTNVWDSNYGGVWHLNANSGGAGSVLDSTSHGNHGSPQNSPSNISGKIDGGIGLVHASAQYVNCGNNGSLKSTTFTMSCWIWVDIDTLLTVMMGDLDVGGIMLLYRGPNAPSDRQPYLAVKNGSTETDCFGVTGTLTNHQWYYSVGTYDGSNLKIYRDGALERSVSQANAVSTNSVFFGIGSGNVAGYTFAGNMDEARFSNVARSSDWILTEYNNQNAPGNIGADNFVMFGAESLVPAVGGPNIFVVT